MDEYRAYVMAVFSQKDFKSAIDIGCTHGAMTAWLNQKCPTVGLDISAGYIEKARKYFPSVKFVVGDIGKYNPKKKFDVAITHGLLIHVPPEDISRIIKHILTIAKCGLFTESSTEPDYEPRRKMKYDAKKYWEHRAKHKEVGKDLPMQYYFNHNYPDIFNDLGLRFQVVRTFDPKTKTRLYYAWN